MWKFCGVKEKIHKFAHIGNIHYLCGEKSELMLQIGNVLVTLDIVEKFFCCDLSACKGECCIEGDAGAPLTVDEQKRIEALLPQIWDCLLPAAQRAIKEDGVAYRDIEGDLVTQIIDGKNCVFTCYAPEGVCLCAIEKAYRDGRIAENAKPMSCYLYPLRLKQIGGMTAVNFHNWKICKSAEVKGRREGIRVYQFLKEPLIRRFGEQWYDELALTCQEYLRQMTDD